MVFKRSQDVIGTDEDCAKMLRVRKVPLNTINEQITCNLCKGYFVDATTIIECLHTFCRSCIVKYLETHKYCPVCDVLVHKTRPLTNIRPDKTMQDIVYKLVPRLHQDEMRRRREFYVSHPESTPSPLEEKNEVQYDYVLAPEDNLCVSLNYFESPALPRYLKCPAAVTIAHLQRLISGKYELSEAHHVDIYYNEDCLHSYLTLMEVAYIYDWRRKGPLELTYRIFENRSKRQKLNSDDASATNNNNWKEVQLRISENGEISVTGIQDNLVDEIDKDFVIKSGTNDQKILSESTEKQSNIAKDSKVKHRLKASKKGDAKHGRKNNHKNNSANCKGVVVEDKNDESQGEAVDKSTKFDERMEIDEVSLLQLGGCKVKNDKENGSNQKALRRAETSQNHSKKKRNVIDTGQNLADRSKNLNLRENISSVRENESLLVQTQNNKSSNENLIQNNLQKSNNVVPGCKSLMKANKTQGKSVKTSENLIKTDIKLNTNHNLQKTAENPQTTNENQKKTNKNQRKRSESLEATNEHQSALNLNRTSENLQKIGENLQQENKMEENKIGNIENIGKNQQKVKNLSTIASENENVSRGRRNQQKAKTPDNLDNGGENREIPNCQNVENERSPECKVEKSSDRNKNPDCGSDNFSVQNENVPISGRNRPKTASQTTFNENLDGKRDNLDRLSGCDQQSSLSIKNDNISCKSENPECRAKNVETKNENKELESCSLEKTNPRGQNLPKQSENFEEVEKLQQSKGDTNHTGKLTGNFKAQSYFETKSNENVEKINDNHKAINKSPGRGNENTQVEVTEHQKKTNQLENVTEMKEKLTKTTSENFRKANESENQRKQTDNGNKTCENTNKPLLELQNRNGPSEKENTKDANECSNDEIAKKSVQDIKQLKDSTATEFKTNLDSNAKSGSKSAEANKNIITTSIYPISGVKGAVSSAFGSSTSNKRKIEEKSEYEPQVKQPTILNHTLGLQNLSNNHPLKKHSMSTPQSNKWVNKSSTPGPPCYTPRTTVYNPIINVPKPQTSVQKVDAKAKEAKSAHSPILNSKVPIKNKPGAPIGYKTLRDPPKSWNPQLPRPMLNRGAADAKGVELKNVRPPKFFKIRNNMPRYLGNPASGVKPMYQVHTSPEKEKADKTENIKKHSIVKIDPKTLKPISERAPETSNLSRTTDHTDLKINTSSVSIFNPLKLQSSSPKSGDRKSPKSPNKILNFTPPNPFIPNLQSPTISPNQFLFPGPFNSYDPRMMAAYHSFLYGQTRLPFVNHLTGMNVELNRKNFELQKMQQAVATMPSTSTTPAAANKTNTAMKKSKDKNEKSLQNAVEKLTQSKLKEKENSQARCTAGEDDNVKNPPQEEKATKNGESNLEGSEGAVQKENGAKSDSKLAVNTKEGNKLAESLVLESHANSCAAESK